MRSSTIESGPQTPDGVIAEHVVNAIEVFRGEQPRLAEITFELDSLEDAAIDWGTHSDERGVVRRDSDVLGVFINSASVVFDSPVVEDADLMLSQQTPLIAETDIKDVYEASNEPDPEALDQVFKSYAYLGDTHRWTKPWVQAALVDTNVGRRKPQKLAAVKFGYDHGKKRVFTLVDTGVIPGGHSVHVGYDAMTLRQLADSRASINRWAGAKAELPRQ